MKKFYAILNSILVIAVIVWNFYTNAASINGNTVGELSNKYDNLFTPAGYAFSIWGLIYLGLVAHCVYQLLCAFSKRNDDFIVQIGPWLAFANLGNALWLWFWLQEDTLVSVFIMALILFSLIKIILNLNMEKWDAPLSTIAFVWWPICLYSGWITVATIANVAAYLSKIEWSPLLSETTWAILMISVATAINIFMILTRNMREFAAVGVWALIAIAVRHWNTLPLLQWFSLGCSFIILGFIAWHGYQNRKTNPVYRMGEKV
jgi:hypothetical protein